MNWVLGLVIFLTSPFWFVLLIVALAYISLLCGLIVVGVVHLIETIINLFKKKVKE